MFTLDIIIFLKVLLHTKINYIFSLIAEVRSASVDALCNLALHHPEFSLLSLDFLVDMFNDEIEAVRIKAIDSLTSMSRHILLREHQLETVLGALEVGSIILHNRFYW